MSDASTPFRLQVGYDQPELLGARWWYEGHVVASRSDADAGLVDNAARAADLASRRMMLATLFTLVGGSLVVGVAATRCGSTRSVDVQRLSLDLQREQGLMVGSDLHSFAWLDAVPTDAEGKGLDRSSLPGLAAELRPASAELVPFYVPTLFQALTGAGSEVLVTTATCIDSRAMRIAFARGRALREQLELAEQPHRWAIVVDLPGPESTAFAAALAPAAEAVFTFDNWPHPRGVVPAHLTLGALLFHRPHFLERASRRVPPVFVLDRLRLTPLQGTTHEFDNRYRARLPSAASLQQLGIERVLYVIPEGAREQELDDLNERFVDYRNGALTVQLLGLADLQPGPDDAAAPPSTANSGDSSSNSSSSSHAMPRYYWGGGPGQHYWFWNHYGWASRPGPRPAERPAQPLIGSVYRPEARPTVWRFQDDVGKTHTSPRSTSSSSSSRSGSWGRSSGGGFG